MKTDENSPFRIEFSGRVTVDEDIFYIYMAANENGIIDMRIKPSSEPLPTMSFDSIVKSVYGSLAK